MLPEHPVTSQQDIDTQPKVRDNVGQDNAPEVLLIDQEEPIKQAGNDSHKDPVMLKSK